MGTITVHVVFQAHLDPVWLWPWQAGMDEALATCRTACDLLDQYPDAIFAANEAWRYAMVEQIEPGTFERIRRHVRAGRWEIVGGWYIQPDCNFPSGFGFERQIALGKKYFTEKFGFFPDIAYNVDSFGHAATLPGFMRAAGQKHYVMMRPSESELKLPARLFRWRGFEGAPEVSVFRIAGSYCTEPAGMDAAHVRRALSELPPGIAHTMCFLGVGDHGGGMTAAMIEWVAANADAIEGARLVFSSPSRFFKAVEGQIESLPLVTGELQMHAPGCYTVGRGIKTRVRRGEDLLRQAEIITAGDASVQPAIDEAWRRICFNQFRDTLGGACIPSAYVQQHEQADAGCAAADEIVQMTLRRKAASLPDDPLQRIVLCNASDRPYNGYAEHDAWTQPRRWSPEWRLLDDAGRPIPFQTLRNEAGGFRTRLFRVSIPPGAMQVIRIDRQGGPVAAQNLVRVEDRLLASESGAAVSLGAEKGLNIGGARLALPRLELIEDRSDNWSHGVQHFPDGPVTSARWNDPWVADDRGPLMASMFQTGRIGHSALKAEWRVYAGEPFVELRLNVHWREALRLLRLVLPLPGESPDRRDGIPGGSLLRPNSGVERPLAEWTLCGNVGVVSPDVYAIEGAPARLRFTLLRSPVMTQHDPSRDVPPRARFADQGEHNFRLRFFAGAGVTARLLEDHALMLRRPLLAADLTRGMPKRYGF